MVGKANCVLRCGLTAETPGIEYMSIDQAERCHFAMFFNAPGESEHPAFANPLHHPLRPLDLGADSTVPTFELAAPPAQFIAGDVRGERDDRGRTIDTGYPDIDG